MIVTVIARVRSLPSSVKINYDDRKGERSASLERGSVEISNLGIVLPIASSACAGDSLLRKCAGRNDEERAERGKLLVTSFSSSYETIWIIVTRDENAR
jgi:hypothetical protein